MNIPGYEERTITITQSSGNNNHCRCINGMVTGSNKCVGFCSYSGHPGYLTQDLRKRKNCIKKECRHYLTKQEKRELTARKEMNIWIQSSATNIK